MSTTWESSPERPAGAAPPPSAPPPSPSPERSGPAWPLWAALLAVPTAVLVANVVGTPVVLLGGDVDDPPGWALLVATYLQTAVFIGVPLAFAWTVARPYAEDFGLRWPKFWPALGWMALALVTVNVVGGLVSLLFDVDQNDQDNIIDSLGIDEGTIELWLLMFAVCVLAPLGEEFLFRGFVFAGLARAIGVAGGAVGSGVIFGLLHITNYIGDEVKVALSSIIVLTLLGTALALLYWRTGSLVPCIALHAINNSIAFGVMQDWTWQIAPLMAGALAICGISVWLARRFWRRVPAPWPAPSPSH